MWDSVQSISELEIRGQQIDGRVDGEAHRFELRHAQPCIRAIICLEYHS